MLVDLWKSYCYLKWIFIYIYIQKVWILREILNIFLITKVTFKKYNLSGPKIVLNQPLKLESKEN